MRACVCHFFCVILRTYFALKESMKANSLFFRTAVMAILLLCSAGSYAGNTALNGVFTVSAEKQVCFSSTGLHYQTFPVEVEEGWRLLTGAEWSYLLSKGEEPGEYFGMATVCTEHGLVLLPDNWWSNPDAPSFRPGTDGKWDTNQYTAEQWEAMEAAGAVFLPAAGYQEGPEISAQNEWGYYWSSSTEDEANGYILYFSKNSADAPYSCPFANGCSVRLVKDTQYTPTSLGEVQGDDVQCTKVLQDGRLYLMYEGQMYDVRGAKGCTK